MDKRWIYIIIIAIIGVGCLYFIAESSTIIGSANTDLDKFLLKVPDSFNIEKSTDTQIRLINRQSGERINILFLGTGSDVDDDIDNKIESLSKNTNITLLKNTTLKLKNTTVPCIYYEKSPNTSVNKVAFITKFDCKFSIECANFNDNESVDKNIKEISDTLKRDFKQKQD